MTKQLAALLVAASMAVAAPAHAQAPSAWPLKPVKLIVSYGAGGPPDVLGRILAQAMSEGLGQPIVIENRVGAAGTIGAEAAAKAPADGYTLLLASTTIMAIAPGLYPRLGYDPARDFAPIGQAVVAPFFVMVNAAVPATNVKELVDLLKSHPAEFYYGSSGNGTPLHIAGEMFKSATGVNIVHVPYKDIGPATADFLAGRFQIMFQQLAPLERYIRAGKVRPLVVADSRRLAQLPDVPSNVEAGLPGFDVVSWFGFVAPRGTPAEAVRRVNAELQRALAKQEVRDSLAKLGFEPVGGTPEEFAGFIARETAKWSRAIHASGAKVD